MFSVSLVVKTTLDVSPASSSSKTREHSAPGTGAGGWAGVSYDRVGGYS